MGDFINCWHSNHDTPVNLDSITLKLVPISSLNATGGHSLCAFSFLNWKYVTQLIELIVQSTGLSGKCSPLHACKSKNPNIAFAILATNA